MIRTVRPGIAEGRIDAPPSKSYTHRALIAGYFARRPYRVLRPLVADDTRATRRGLERLGSRVRGGSRAWTMRPSPNLPRHEPIRIDCGESGTTFRFLTTVAATTGQRVRFVGRPQLAARPVDGLTESLVAAGVRVGRPPVGSLPLEVQGPIRPGRLSVPGSVSSQYVSSLLLALPTLQRSSTLTVLGARVSEPYIETTLAVMAAHGIQVRRRPRGWSIPAPQEYDGRSFTVPGDASSAAYLWTAAALSGGRVSVARVPSFWPQADRRILDVLRDAGATVRESSGSVEVSGPVRDRFEVDLTASPDLYPLVGALAAAIPASSTLRGAAHVVFKESNRRAATIDLVRRIGGSARPSGTGLVVRGTERPKAIRVRGLDDHRLVMSAAVAATVARAASTIGDSRAVRKSFPGFWSAMKHLGIDSTEAP